MHLNFRYIFFIAAARSEHVAPLPSADRSFLQGQSVVQEGRQERALLNQRTRKVEDLTNEIQKLRDGIRTADMDMLPKLTQQTKQMKKYLEGMTVDTESAIEDAMNVMRTQSRTLKMTLKVSERAAAKVLRQATKAETRVGYGPWDMGENVDKESDDIVKEEVPNQLQESSKAPRASFMKSLSNLVRANGDNKRKVEIAQLKANNVFSGLSKEAGSRTEAFDAARQESKQTMDEKQAEADEDMEGLFDDLKVKMKNHYKLQRKMYKAIRKVDNALANEFNTKTLEKAVKRATKTMDKNHDRGLTRLEKANNKILTKRYLPVVQSFYEKVRDHFRALVLALRDDSVFTERYANNEADKFTKLGERMREVKQDVKKEQGDVRTYQSNLLSDVASATRTVVDRVKMETDAIPEDSKVRRLSQTGDIDATVSSESQNIMNSNRILTDELAAIVGEVHTQALDELQVMNTAQSADRESVVQIKSDVAGTYATAGNNFQQLSEWESQTEKLKSDMERLSTEKPKLMYDKAQAFGADKQETSDRLAAGNRRLHDIATEEVMRIQRVGQAAAIDMQVPVMNENKRSMEEVHRHFETSKVSMEGKEERAQRNILAMQAKLAEKPVVRTYRESSIPSMIRDNEAMQNELRAKDTTMRNTLHDLDTTQRDKIVWQSTDKYEQEGTLGLKRMRSSLISQRHKSEAEFYDKIRKIQTDHSRSSVDQDDMVTSARSFDEYVRKLLEQFEAVEVQNKREMTLLEAVDPLAEMTPGITEIGVRGQKATADAEARLDTYFEDSKLLSATSAVINENNAKADIKVKAKQAKGFLEERAKLNDRTILDAAGDLEKKVNGLVENVTGDVNSAMMTLADVLPRGHIDSINLKALIKKGEEDTSEADAYDDAGSGAKRKGAALEDSFLDRLTRLHSSMNSKLNSYAAANGGTLSDGMATLAFLKASGLKAFAMNSGDWLAAAQSADDIIRDFNSKEGNLQLTYSKFKQFYDLYGILEKEGQQGSHNVMQSLDGLAEDSGAIEDGTGAIMGILQSAFAAMASQGKRERNAFLSSSEAAEQMSKTEETATLFALDTAATDFLGSMHTDDINLEALSGAMYSQANRVKTAFDTFIGEQKMQSKLFDMKLETEYRDATEDIQLIDAYNRSAQGDILKLAIAMEENLNPLLRAILMFEHDARKDAWNVRDRIEQYKLLGVKSPTQMAWERGNEMRSESEKASRMLANFMELKPSEWQGVLDDLDVIAGEQARNSDREQTMHTREDAYVENNVVGALESVVNATEATFAGKSNASSAEMETMIADMETMMNNSIQDSASGFNAFLNNMLNETDVDRQRTFTALAALLMSNNTTDDENFFQIEGALDAQTRNALAAAREQMRLADEATQSAMVNLMNGNYWSPSTTTASNTANASALLETAAVSMQPVPPRPAPAGRTRRAWAGPVLAAQHARLVQAHDRLTRKQNALGAAVRSAVVASERLR